MTDRADVDVRLIPLELLLRHLLSLLSKSSRRPAIRRTKKTYSLCAGPHGLAGTVLDDALGEVAGDLLVPVELHRVVSSALRGGAQVRGVAEHLREGHAGLHREGVAARLLSLHAPAAAREVADHVPEELLRGHHLDRHHRLEQHRLGSLGRLLERQRSGDLERELRGVGLVVLAVGEGDANVHHREAGPDARLERLLDALLHGRDELRWDRAALDLVDEVEALARRRLEVDVNDAVLARAAGLTDEPALDLLGGPAHGLAVGDLGAADGGLDAELALHAIDQHLEMQLAHSGDHRLPRLLVAAN